MHSSTDAVVQENADKSVIPTETSEGKSSVVEEKQGTKERTALERRKDQYSEFKDKILCDMDFYFSKQIHHTVSSGFFCVHSIISKEDEDRLRFSQFFKEMQEKGPIDVKQLGFESKKSRGIAAIMGMAIGDALGASTEFENFKK